MEPPDVADLKEQLAAPRLFHEIPERRQLVARRLLEMQMLAGRDHFAPPRDGLGGAALDHHKLDARIPEQFFRAEPPQSRRNSAGTWIRLMDAGNFVVAGILERLQLAGDMGVLRPKERSADLGRSSKRATRRQPRNQKISSTHCI